MGREPPNPTVCNEGIQLKNPRWIAGQPLLRNFHGRGAHCLPGESSPLGNSSSLQKVLPNVESESPSLSFESITLGPALQSSRKQASSIFRYLFEEYVEDFGASKGMHGW